MTYFPSTDELNTLGFEKKPDHHHEYDNWVCQAGYRKYFRIVKRRKPIYSVPEVRIQILDRPMGRIKSVAFIGYFLSFEFLKLLLIGVRCFEIDGIVGYFPSNEYLNDLGFNAHNKCPSGYSKCWRKTLADNVHIMISINISEIQVELVSNDGHTHWYWFKGYLPSKEFFEQLLRHFHSIYELNSNSASN